MSDILEAANRACLEKQWLVAKKILQSMFAKNTSRDERYVACLKLNDVCEALGQNNEGFHYMELSHTIDSERVEGLYVLIRHYACVGNPEKALAYYKQIQEYYEHRYWDDTTIQTRLEFNKSIYELYLPYYMIIVTSRLGLHTQGLKMFEIVFQQKWMETTDFYIGNLIYNFQFFCDKIPKPNEVFITHMISYFNTMSDHDFKLDRDLAKRYICAFNPSRIHEVKTLKEQKFSKEECKKCKNILIYTGFSNTPWNHTTMTENGTGGTETCIAKLATQFPSDYRIYVTGGVKDETKENVSYVGFSKLNNLLETTPFQIVIISRYIAFLEDYEFSTDTLYVWIHDTVLLGHAFGRTCDVTQILYKWNYRIDSFVCLTEWHKTNILQLYPTIRDKIKIIPNGIESSVFQANLTKVKNRFVFTSRPERGYKRLLELWSDICSVLPGAELKLATYVKYPATKEEEEQFHIIQKISSIEWLGCLNSKQLYDLIGTAEYWLYPTDFCETFCITGIEMLRSEVICFYYPIAALQNTVGEYGIPLNHGTELETIVAVANNTEHKERIKERGLSYAKTFDWPVVYKRWVSELNLPSQTKNILIWTGFDYSTWNYTTMIEKGLGGAETCVINIARQFPSDYKVYISGSVKAETVGNITFVDYQKLPTLLRDTHFYATIVSRYIGFLEDYTISTDKLFVWIHEDHILPWAWGRAIDVHEVLKKHNSRIHNYICLSEWHKNEIRAKYPYIADKLTILPNGIRNSLFPTGVVKKPNRFVFTSTPERGYTKLLELFGEILKRIPDAELKLATYVAFPRNEHEKELMKQIEANPKIEFVGCLKPTALYDLLWSAEYWLYPLVQTEAFCITGIEMLRSQVVCFYYPIAALVTTVGDYGIPLGRGTEVDTIVAVAKDTERKERMKARGLAYAKTFDWAFVYNRWSELL